MLNTTPTTTTTPATAEKATTLAARLRDAWKQDHFAGESEFIRFEAIARAADALERIADALEANTNGRH